MPETFWAAVETVPTSQDACDQPSGTLYRPFFVGHQGRVVASCVSCNAQNLQSVSFIVESLSCFPFANMPPFTACGGAGICAEGN